MTNRTLLFLIGSILLGNSMLEGSPRTVTFTPSAATVQAYDFVEIKLEVDSPDAANPFTDVHVTGWFERAGGRDRLNLDGFCDSQDGKVFRIRFMPSRPGDYSYSVSYRQGDFEKSATGTFAVTDGRRRGVVRVDPQYPWHFIWEGTGEHFFWNGTTTYFLMGFKDERVIEAAIDRLRALKVNRLRVLLSGRYSQPWGEPVITTEEFKLWLEPWVAERPDDIANPGFDYARYNVSHWQKYERLLRYARGKDVTVSVIFDIAGPYHIRPAELSEDEQRYFRYGVARLAAYSNVLWDLGNEHDFYRKYPQWADEMGPRMKAWDPYDHLTSAHNRIYRTSPWADFTMVQDWSRPLNNVMLNLRAEQARTGRIIPQINEEYGYEDHYAIWSPNFPDGQSADANRRAAWEISMAGCYQTTGETAKRGTGVWPNTGGGWVNGRGDKSMIMLEGYAHMVEFFARFEWWKAEPRNDLADGGAMCLAQPANLYAVYLPMGRRVKVRVEAGNYQVTWFNPRTGESSPGPIASGPEWVSPEPPDHGDWAILLKK